MTHSAICERCDGHGRRWHLLRLFRIPIWWYWADCASCGGVGLDRSRLVIVPISPGPPMVGENFAHYKKRTGYRSPEEAFWESYPRVEGNQVIGYCVRWSKQDAEGRWLGRAFQRDPTSAGLARPNRPPSAALRLPRRTNHGRPRPCRPARGPLNKTSNWMASMKNIGEFKGYCTRVVFNPLSQRFEYQHEPHGFEMINRLTRDDPMPAAQLDSPDRSDSAAGSVTWKRRAA